MAPTNRKYCNSNVNALAEPVQLDGNRSNGEHVAASLATIPRKTKPKRSAPRVRENAEVSSWSVQWRPAYPAASASG
jgi:hypothetical protein